VDKIWLSVHLFREGNLDKFILDFIFPLSNFIISKQLADGFFYIRYGEGGKHIRLRFYGYNTVLENEVKELIISRFNNFIAQYPSKTNIPRPPNFFPNDSAVFIPYIKETRRYGGEYFLVLAEKQFKYSSEAVFQILNINSSITYEEKLGKAVILHLIFIYRMGLMKDIELLEFFKLNGKMWTPHACKNLYGVFNLNVRQDLFIQYASTLDLIKSPIFNAIEFTLFNLSEGSNFDIHWIQSWSDKMRTIKFRTNILLSENLIFNPNKHNFSGCPKTWSIFSDMMHMTNNRLGILNSDECFLYYIIFKYFESRNSSYSNF